MLYMVFVFNNTSKCSLKDTLGYFGWYLIRFIFNISIISAFHSYTVLSAHARGLQSVNTENYNSQPEPPSFLRDVMARMKTVAW